MKHRGEPEQFDTRAEAEAVAQHYRDQINANTICAKTYTVIKKRPDFGRYTITGCPNKPAIKAAAARLKPDGYNHRNRGRGPRFARYPGDDRYHQSLPLGLAWYFTIYGEPKEHQQTWNPWIPITHRCEFVKLEKSGKLRVRLLNENH
jgi:hypothetical protein